LDLSWVYFTEPRSPASEYRNKRMDKRVLVNIFSRILAATLCVVCAAPSPVAHSSKAFTARFNETGADDKTDRRVYPEPKLPRLPSAGGTITDPIFQTEIMRVTDERDGASNGTYYAYWPTFNSDSTRLLVKKDGGDAALYNFDPQSFKLGASKPFPRLPDGGSLITEGAIWSASDPNVLYGVQSGRARLWGLKVATRTYTLIRDFNEEFNEGDYLWQMSMSDNADVFAFTRRNSSGATIGYIVWQRSTNRVLNVADNRFNEVRLDKTGRYLTIPLNKADERGKSFYIRDLQTGRITGLTDGKPDYSPGHADTGSGMLIGWDRWDNRLLYRTLAAPHQFRSVLDLGSDWSMNMHVSLLGENEDWVLISFYSYQSRPPAGAFHDELVLVKTDGSQRVRRIAHHRSVAKDYWEIPKANLSRDGRFIAFTSNWGGSGRNDLFIARVEATDPARTQRQQRTTPTERPTQRPRRVRPN
jgi:hypothetical protein